MVNNKKIKLGLRNVHVNLRIYTKQIDKENLEYDCL